MSKNNLAKYLILLRRRRGQSQLKFKRLKSMLHRRKSIKYPKLPKTHAEAYATLQNPTVSREIGQTADDFANFYVNSVSKEEHVFHVFASYSVIELIKKQMVGQPRRYLIDGTFKVIPREFAQLLVIAIEYKKKVGKFEYQNIFAYTV